MCRAKLLAWGGLSALAAGCALLLASSAGRRTKTRDFFASPDPVAVPKTRAGATTFWLRGRVPLPCHEVARREVSWSVDGLQAEMWVYARSGPDVLYVQDVRALSTAITIPVVPGRARTFLFPRRNQDPLPTA